jgi:hypothetical protein
MGVIDSVVNGNLLIVKTYIDLTSTDERTLSIGTQIIKDSIWSVQKASSLVNFNKAFVAAQSFAENLIQDSILDPAHSMEST